jgi:hypothetical protein
MQSRTPRASASSITRRLTGSSTITAFESIRSVLAASIQYPL